VPAPASLLAFTAWQSGNGALANVALERALEADPAYSMALLLRDVIDAGAPPSMARLPMTPEEVAASYAAAEAPDAPDDDRPANDVDDDPDDVDLDDDLDDDLADDLDDDPAGDQPGEDEPFGDAADDAPDAAPADGTTGDRAPGDGQRPGGQI
jgi:hypothetical protein